MKNASGFIRRPLPRRSSLRKSLTIVAEIIGAVIMFALLIILAVLVMAL